MADIPISPDEIKGVLDFLYKIDWSDQWLWFLILFHLIFFVLTMISIVFSLLNVQTVLFFSSLLLVYCSEYINEWAAQNYKLFSKEQYFDDKGMFISLLYSAPLLFNSLVIVVAWLYQAYLMLCQIQKKKMQKKKKAE